MIVCYRGSKWSVLGTETETKPGTTMTAATRDAGRHRGRAGTDLYRRRRRHATAVQSREQNIQIAKGPSAPQVVTMRTIYDGSGRFLPIHTVDPLGHVTTFEYNKYNQLTAIIDALGHRREYVYDTAAAASAATPNRYDLVRTSERSYDAAGNAYDDQRELRVCTLRRDVQSRGRRRSREYPQVFRDHRRAGPFVAVRLR